MNCAATYNNKLRKHSQKTKDKIRQKLTGRKLSPDTKRKIGDKISVVNLGRKAWNYGLKNIYKKESNDKRRIARQKLILENGGGPQIGNNEKEILDRLEKIFGYKIIRQYPVLGYWLDGYIKEIKLAIEVDEKHHKRIIIEDKNRQEKIIKKLNCSFLRINDNGSMVHRKLQQI
jgi:hypothetical protein